VYCFIFFGKYYQKGKTSAFLVILLLHSFPLGVLLDDHTCYAGCFFVATRRCVFFK